MTRIALALLMLVGCTPVNMGGPSPMMKCCLECKQVCAPKQVVACGWSAWSGACKDCGCAP